VLQEELDDEIEMYEAQEEAFAATLDLLELMGTLNSKYLGLDNKVYDPEKVLRTRNGSCW